MVRIVLIHVVAVVAEMPTIETKSLRFESGVNIGFILIRNAYFAYCATGARVQDCVRFLLDAGLSGKGNHDLIFVILPW